MLLTSKPANLHVFVLSKELRYIHLAQGSANLPAVKVESPKQLNLCGFTYVFRSKSWACCQVACKQFKFFGPSTLATSRFRALIYIFEKS